jgi:hypothetical protein
MRSISRYCSHSSDVSFSATLDGVAAVEGDWVRFATALAAMPDVVRRLLDAHRDDGKGRCRACTTPGRGTPHTVWPCGIAAIAAAAAGIAFERDRVHGT